LNGAQALVEMLIGYDVEVVFGLPGDTSVDFYDALRTESHRITHLMAVMATYLVRQIFGR